MCEHFAEKTFPSSLRLAFWPSGPYFSACPFLGDLEQIRASAWQSGGLVVIPMVCKAAEGDMGILCWGLDWGAWALVLCVCVFRVCSVSESCHVGLLLKVTGEKIARSRECL